MVWVQEEEAQPLLQAATGSVRGMAPALVQLFESRMKAGISRRAGSKAKKAAAASAEAPEAAAPDAAAEPAAAADAAGPAQVRSNFTPPAASFWVHQ